MPSESASAVRQTTEGAYRLEFGETWALVDPELAGRVTALVHGGQQLLATSQAVAGAGDAPQRNQFGSSFWVSPQSLWKWPPELEVDSEMYHEERLGNGVRMWGEPGAKSGLAVEKRFLPGADALTLQYTMRNGGAQAQSAAPWELTRVPKGGLVVFPAEGPALPPSTLGSEMRDQVAWLDLRQAPSKDAKLFQDGREGWLAYVWQGVAFIKSFEDVPRAEQAPGEAEIEIYVNGRYDYLELEQQGQYSAIAPGGRSEPWQVEWRVRTLPKQLEAVVGNEKLVNWIRAKL